MNKKSQGMPLNIIIIAAIGLAVLVIIIFIFRGESDKFIKSTNCPAREGKCLKGLSTCPEGKEIKIYTNDCPEVVFDEQKKVYISTTKKGPGQCCIPLN